MDVGASANAGEDALRDSFDFASWCYHISALIQVADVFVFGDVGCIFLLLNFDAFIFVYDFELFEMLFERLFTQSDCDFWKFGHYGIPICFSNEEAKATGRGFVQETGMLAEQASMLAYRFACRRMVCLWCIFVPQNVKLLTIDFKPNIKLPFSDKNDFLNFLQLVENYNLIFYFPRLQIPKYHKHKLL